MFRSKNSSSRTWMSGKGPLSPGWRVGLSAFNVDVDIGTFRYTIIVVRRKAESSYFHVCKQIIFLLFTECSFLHLS